MKLLLSLAFLSSTVLAGANVQAAGLEEKPPVRLDLEPKDANPIVATLHIENVETFDANYYNIEFVRVVEVDGYGPLLLEISSTRNESCDPKCPDDYRVVKAPDGLYPVPREITIDEEDVGKIDLFLIEALDLG